MKNTEGAPAPLADADGIRKYLPRSYRTAFNFTTPRTEFAKTDDSYHCAIKRSSEKNRAFKQSKDEITWGRVIAFCLRQPLLAERIGLLHRLSVTLPSDDYFKEGGWVSCRLTSALADFDIVNADTELRSYAARIPADRRAATAVRGAPVPGRRRARAAQRRLRHAQDRGGRLRRRVREGRARDPARQLEPSQRGARRHAPAEGHRRPPRLGRRAAADLAEPADALRPGDAGQARRRPARGVLLPGRRSRDRRSRLALARPHPEQGGADAGGTVDRPRAGRARDRRPGLPRRRSTAPSTRRTGCPATSRSGTARRSSSPTAAPRSSTPPARSPSPAPTATPTSRRNRRRRAISTSRCCPTDCELKYGHEYEFRVRLGDLTGGGPARGRRRAERRAGDERIARLPAIRRAEAPDRHARRSAGRRRRGLGPVPPGPRPSPSPARVSDIPRSSSPSSTPTTRSRSCWTTRRSSTPPSPRARRSRSTGTSATSIPTSIACWWSST